MRTRHLILGGFAAFLILAAPAQAGLFGESDEEKAARVHEQNQDAAIADLKQRVHDLEDSLSQSTGQNEALAHQVQQLNDKIERQKKDFEYRLCALSAQQLGANQSEDAEQSAAAIPCPGGAPVQQSYNAPPPQQQQQNPQAAVHLAPPPGVLGTLPAGKTAAMAPAAAGNPQSHGQFDAALDLLAKARYDEARAQFRTYADANPGDELAPQAIYWVGDIDFVQKDYANAAHAFAEQIKKYPTSTRSPDSMLKLGKSLLAMGQTKEGCMTLGAFNSRYPNAAKNLAAQAASERKASCH
ncbi:MAG TPA: tol-pal system protein YbgF [Rhizomicrobium sp.]|nr:tol-pal system protein YbgF [Rhizomicrobium sp.]